MTEKHYLPHLNNEPKIILHPKYTPGSWVRFSRYIPGLDRNMVIGKVEYVTQDDSSQKRITIVTDAGNCTPDMVYEVR